MTYQANILDKFKVLITEKTYCYFNVILHSRKRNFCHTKLQTIISKEGFFQVLIFDSKLDTLPKTYQGGTNYIKISIKITHYQLF